MSAGNDIFGNLDDFLENYDDNYLEMSKLSEAETDLDDSITENGQPNRNNKSAGTVAKSNPKTTLVDSTKNDQTEQSAVVSRVAEPAPSSASSVLLPPPTLLTNSVDLTAINLDDEMQEMARMFGIVFYNKDPTVMTYLKSHHLYNPTKRSFNALNHNFHQELPTTSSEIAKFKKRIETVQTNLIQLYSLAENFIMIKSNTAQRSTPAARRRSRRLANSTVAPTNVITLDDDGPFNIHPSTSLAVGNSVIDVDAPNVIALDSDDESFPLEYPPANNSFESENYEMRIKIKWGNGIETFTHRKHQKFGDLITQLATKEAADSRSILLNLDDRIIHADDTPDSIGYKTFQFISGRVLRDKAPICIQKQVTSSADNKNILSLKVQLANRKAPLRLQMDKNQTMIVLVIKCAEELKCNPEDIRLYFDGELVDNCSKPEDLDLEGDELLDIRLLR